VAGCITGAVLGGVGCGVGATVGIVATVAGYGVDEAYQGLRVSSINRVDPKVRCAVSKRDPFIVGIVVIAVLTAIMGALTSNLGLLPALCIAVAVGLAAGVVIRLITGRR